MSWLTIVTFFNTWSPNNLWSSQSLRLRLFYWIKKNEIKVNFRIHYVLVVLTVNNSFGFDRSVLAKYFTIWYLFSYWLFPLLVPLVVCWRCICCITGLVAFLHFVWLSAKSRLKHFFIQVSVNYILPTNSGSIVRS